MANRYRYNGKELHDELGLNWYDYGARMYDPAVGRWNGVDALADSFPTWSPYNYAVNNPVLVTDPDGNDTLVMHVAFSATLSNKYFNVFTVSYSLITNGKEQAVNIEGSLFMFSNKKSDEKGENSLNQDKFYGIRARRRKKSQDRIDSDPGTWGEAYKNEFNIVKIDENGDEQQIGARGVFIHYGNNYTHFDGCKGLCEFPRKRKATITSLEGSISALSKMQKIYAKFESRLTGQKFLLEPNSQVVSGQMGPLTHAQYKRQINKQKRGISYRIVPPLN